MDGTLLLTGKTVMFDPYLHHPLVAESSVDNYQVILPMNLVVNAVILTDYQKNSSENEPDPSLIFYKSESTKDAEASDLVAAAAAATTAHGDSEKENENENIQTQKTGRYFILLR